MVPVTHQTIRLGKGKHNSPQDGACVMELASMLAGERFSDHPVSVCPVIGAFLRAYNDSIDGEHRQDLYAYAAKVVGSRTSQEVQSARVAHLASWASVQRQRRWSRFVLPLRWRALAGNSQPDAVASRAVRAIRMHDDRMHAEVLALIDELLMIGASEEPSPATLICCYRRPAQVTS